MLEEGRVAARKVVDKSDELREIYRAQGKLEILNFLLGLVDELRALNQPKGAEVKK